MNATTIQLKESLNKPGVLSLAIKEKTAYPHHVGK